MTHLDPEQAVACAAGSLSATERGEVIAHIGECEDCRQWVAALTKQRTTDPSHSAPGSEPARADTTVVSAPSVDARDPMVGAVLGNYRIEALIARGGMGAVYSAVSKTNGDSVAIKVLQPQFARDPEQMHRLLTEARAIAGIKHPNVIDIRDFGVAPDGRHYFVMEMLRGESLAKILTREGKLPLGRVLSIIAQVLAALEATHRGNVIHRDLKPQNLYVLDRPDGTVHVTLLDFGLARRLEKISVTMPQMVLGTPGYMAPEQINSVTVDGRTDLYAVGALLFHLLTGEPAYARSSHIASMYAQLNEPPPRLSARLQVPEVIDTLVFNLLAKDPAARPASATDVLETIRPLLPVPRRSLQPPTVINRPALLASAVAEGSDLPSRRRGIHQAVGKPRPVVWPVIAAIVFAVLGVGLLAFFRWFR